MGQEHLIAIGISVGLSAVVAYFWVRGIDNMHKKYPNYKGEDFLNWDDVPNTAGRDGWDDNTVHAEGDF